MQTIEAQFRQYHVTKVGARHIGEPHDHKSGGLEPLGPIGVYAYASGYTISGCNQPTRSTQPCIPPGSLNRVPASAGVTAGMSALPGGR